MQPPYTRHFLIIVAGLCVTAFSFAASKNSPNDAGGTFSLWHNKPNEPFSDGAKSFEQVKKILMEHYYDQKLTEDDIYRAAVQGMLAHIDPEKSAWNKLLTPSEVRELMADTSGKVVGIGVEIGFDDESGLISILDVFKDSPAEQAGLKTGHKILRIDGKSFVGRQFRDVVYAMRGTPGTKVSISILDGDQVRKISVKRTSLTWETLTAASISDGVGLLTIRHFTEQTPVLLKNALEKLSATSPRGLIIDLRGNEGGLLDSAIASLDQLVPKGSTIVKIVKRGGIQEDVLAKTGSSFSQRPLIVLVNGSTKSGAEMAAGSLQQNCNATLIGHKTFGKWSIQSVENLPNKYAVKFTKALFLAPNGQDYSGIGLSPDITVDADDEALEKLRREKDVKVRLTKDVQLQTALNYLKKKS